MILIKIKKSEKNADLLRVCKFGGTSLCDSKAILLAVNIIKSNPERRFIVVSAPGKRFPGDSKITDLLYKAYDNPEIAESVLSVIAERFREIAIGLSLPLKSAYLPNKSISYYNSTRAAMASRGEYQTALILSDYLGFDFIDSADVIRFNADGSLNFEKTDRLLKAALSSSYCAVIPGFYGSFDDGRISTFTRGGSDITGSLVAKAASADIYENFTDVDGLFSIDPRISKNGKIIDTLNYSELRSLSYMGASVMHEEAVLPLRGTGIPINIKNTFNPYSLGTFILERSKNSSGIVGISGKKGYTLVDIKLENDSRNDNIFMKAASVFASYSLPVEQVFAGIDRLSFVLRSGNTELPKRVVMALICDIFRSICPISVIVRAGIALMAVVGNVSTLDFKNIDIQSAVLNCGENVFIFALNENDLKKTIILLSENTDIA